MAIPPAPTPPPFSITQIPQIMRNNKWTVGPQLMDNWFARPANSSPHAAVPDTTTVTMSWALGFKRAKDVFDEMIAEKIWVNSKAQPQIVRMLKQKKLLGPQKAQFGNFTLPVPQIDADYIQYRVAGGLFDPIDDLYAALGRLVFRGAVKGGVVPIDKTRFLIAIGEVAIYIYDSYDFNGDQTLGYWNASTNYVGGSPFSGTGVSNADFRAWRAANRRGGDYLIYSAPYILRCTPPDHFETT